LTLKSAETISYCISDILKYYPSLRDDLISKIGATAVEDLDYVKDLHLSDFAIFFELEMDDEERAILDADLTMAIEKGFIGLDDKYKIRDIKILKLAIQYLSILNKKRAKITQEQKAQEAQQKSDMDIRTSQQSNQFAQQTIQVQMQADAIKQKAIMDGEIAKEKENVAWEKLCMKAARKLRAKPPAAPLKGHEYQRESFPTIGNNTKLRAVYDAIPASHKNQESSRRQKGFFSWSPVVSPEASQGMAELIKQAQA